MLFKGFVHYHYCSHILCVVFKVPLSIMCNVIVYCSLGIYLLTWARGDILRVTGENCLNGNCLHGGSCLEMITVSKHMLVTVCFLL